MASQSVKTNLEELLSFFEKTRAQQNFDAVRISIASPEKIREWSHGEVKIPETINYQTFKPHLDGLFCAKIFGPTKDYECNCGKYKRLKHRGAVCEKCGVEVIQSKVRRYRLGHIELCAPVAHIWFLRQRPSVIGTLLDMSLKDLEKVLYFESYVVIEPGNTPLKEKELLSEDRYRKAVEEYGAEFKADMGAAAIKELLKSLDLKALSGQIRGDIRKTKSKTTKENLAKRMRVVEAFVASGNRPEWMTMNVIPVLPPDLRPLVPLDGGRFATSDLNDLYRRVINRNNRLARLQELFAPEVIIRNEKRQLQEAVDALFDNGRGGRVITGPNKRPLKSISDMIKGKDGRFRQNLAEKRVDYSGRSVIVPDPTLKLHQCGLPRRMALELFKPFIYSKLEQKGIATTVKSAKAMVVKEKPEVWDMLEEVIKKHPVILNRVPTLHRLGIQAFEPVLHDDKAIRLHPLVCKAFNADFDGDTMSVHVPLSREAQTEGRVLMMPHENLLSPADGRPIVMPTNEMVLGFYYLTMERAELKVVGETLVVSRNQEQELGGDKPLPYEDRQNRVIGRDVSEFDGRGGPCGLPLERGESEKLFSSTDEVIAAFHAGCISEHAKVKVRIDGQKIETTVGRVLLKDILPAEIPFSFINKAMTGKDVEELVKYSYKKVGNEKTAKFLDNLMGLGFEYATRSGMSICMDDILDVTGMASGDDKPLHYENLQNGISGGDESLPYGDRRDDIMDGPGDLEFERRGGPCGLQTLIREGTRKVEELQKLYAEEVISNPERKRMSVRVWNKTTDKIRQEVENIYNCMGGPCGRPQNQEGTSPSPTEYFQNNIITMMLKAEVMADLNKISQLSGIRGIVEGRNGRVFEHPVLSNYKKGLSTNAYFMTAFSGGKRVSDKLTTRAGHLFRRLIYAASDIIVTEKDCQTLDGVWVNIADGVVGRTLLEDVVVHATGSLIANAHELITEDLILSLKEARIERVKIRSPLTCYAGTGKGVCASCYGTDLSTGKLPAIGTAVGIIAAQSIGSATSQYVMDAWKKEGNPAAWLKEVEDLLEARKPGEKPEKKGDEDSEAEEDWISEMANLFGNEEDDEFNFEEEQAGGDKPLPYDSEESTSASVGDALVASRNPETIQKTGGDKPLPYDVESEENGKDFEPEEGRGDPCGLPPEFDDEIREGTSPSPTTSFHEILERHGMKAAQLYLLGALQRLYDGARININDKHLEVIIRKMSEMVEIKDAGDTEFSVGEVVRKPVFYEVTAHVTFSGGRAAVGQEIIHGITKASKLTDSWISAAAFQDTTKALTNAAIEGKVDNLNGMCENVILGRLIPAGTGFKKT